MTRLALVCVLAAGWPVPAEGAGRIVAVSNARLRIEPSEEVRIVATLPLGTEVVEIERRPDGRWIRVKTADGVEGWMPDALSVRVPDGDRLRVAEGIIRTRLWRQGDGFAAWMQLEGLIDRLAPEVTDRATAARWALHRLKAIRKAADAGQVYLHRSAPVFETWVAARKDVLVYHEPAGQWILRRDAIFEQFERYKGERAADELAWLAVANGLPGECEGYLPCYLAMMDGLEGEYLRRMPAGAFVELALRQLRERLEVVGPVGVDRDNRGSCAEVLERSGALRAAITGAQLRGGIAELASQRALDALAAAGAWCRGPVVS